MKLTVNVQALARELKLLAGVTAKATSIPILGNVLIEAAGDRVALRATDLDLALSSSCRAVVADGGAITVPIRRLLNYIRALPAGDVEMTAESNFWLSLVSGRARARIAGMDRAAFPETLAMPDAFSEMPLSALNAMIGLTAFAVSQEESRFTLQGALLVLEDASLRMVATDGHRLAAIDSEVGAAQSRQLLLPGRVLRELHNLAALAGSDARLRMAEDSNNLFFQVEDRLLVGRKMTGSFPDYKRILPKDFPLSVQVDREEMAAAIDRVGQFSDAASNCIRVSVSNGEVQVHAGVSDVGESDEGLPVQYDGPKIEIAFRGEYMLDFLRVAVGPMVTLLLKDSLSAGEMRPVGELAGKYRYVLMPMRFAS